MKSAAPNRKITLAGTEIAYCLKTTRARNLRITVKPGGVVTAAKPRFLSDRDVEKFLIKKAGWVLKKIAILRNKKPLLASGTRRDYLYQAPRARALVAERLAAFARIYNVNFNRVAIRDQRTRWGSCSRRGNLNFNYRIALLPPALADYIVVHELCHLRELNHSPAFWNLVAKTIPDYRAARRQLKNYIL